MRLSSLRLLSILTTGLLALLTGPAWADAPAAQALSDDPATARAAIAELRAQGSAGWSAMLAVYDALCAQRPPQPGDAAATAPGETQIGAGLGNTRTAPAPVSAADSARLEAQIARAEDAVDAVSGQKYDTVSRLFWYTDLDAAQRAAAFAHKPILSLRMLGNLTEDFSCANSRFFRTTLYSNQQIADYLRAHFILHWQSERPAPKVTIDFGDGRVLERTLTGNSFHYVLDPNGRILDGLPGLYSPPEFLAWLQRTSALAQSCAHLDVPQQTTVLAAYHQHELARIRTNWDAAVAKILVAGGARVLPPPPLNPPSDAPGAGSLAAPVVYAAADSADASTASMRTTSKLVVERPLLARLDLGQPAGQTPDLGLLQKLTENDALWLPLAAQNPVALDNSSVALIRRLNPELVTVTTSGSGGSWRYVNDAPLRRMLADFQSAIALDTVRNEYLLHSQIHAWLAAAAIPPDFTAFNERVYTELFLTSSADPWLGLSPADVYSGLPHNGESSRPAAAPPAPALALAAPR